MQNKIHTTKHPQIDAGDRNSDFNDIVYRILVELLQQITHDVSFHWSRVALGLHHLYSLSLFYYYIKNRMHR